MCGSGLGAESLSHPQLEQKSCVNSLHQTEEPACVFRADLTSVSLTEQTHDTHLWSSHRVNAVIHFSLLNKKKGVISLNSLESNWNPAAFKTVLSLLYLV